MSRHNGGQVVTDLLRESVPNGPMLVRRRAGELGAVHRLDRGKRLGIGRADSNYIVIRDDGCSRNHAEVYWAPEGWMVQDLGSLNGTRVNGRKIDQPVLLGPQDAIAIGQTELVFLDSLTSLNDLVGEEPPSAAANFAIKRRQNQTQTLQLQRQDVARNRSSRDLQTLYRLALQMGQARDPGELAVAVIDALREATPGDGGAILQIDDGGEFVSLGARGASDRPYEPPSDELVSVCLAGRDALLIEEPVPAAPGRNRIAQRTVICSPIFADGEMLAVLHVYSSDPLNKLTSDDLDLAVAITQTMGPALRGMERQLTLASENEQLRESLRVSTELIGRSKAIQDVLAEIAMVAPSNATALICGESGVGKELVARAIHFSSKRRGGPFVCLNCAALPESLLESELFGHEKGAFTGATEQKKGKFEVAHKGTIFLDEIGEMSLSTQAKLLRVLDGHSFERVGGDKPIRAQVRVVAATNRDLEKAVAEGRFRSDLYFRLRVVEIKVPPLRVRVEDVPILAEHFLARYAGEMGKKIKGFSAEAIEKLMAYDWPGNVRELKNAIERAVVLTRNSVIGPEELALNAPARLAVPAAFAPVSLEEIEAEHIRGVLEHTGWNKSQAASILGIERSTLDRKIKRYDISESG